MSKRRRVKVLKEAAREDALPSSGSRKLRALELVVRLD